MRSIWTVAKNTIRQTMRLKIAVIFTVLLLVLLPVMGLKMTGDGTLKGRLQTFVSYGLSLTGLLLCLFTIVSACYSLSSDISQRQIYTVITKPIRRYQYVLGKFAGIVLLDVILLAVFSGIIYGIAVFMPKFVDAEPGELTEVRNEFYTARASLVPEKQDVSNEVEEMFERLRQSRQLPAGIEEHKAALQNYKKELARRIEMSKRAASVGQQLTWRFYNVKLEATDPNFFVRFKYDVSVNPPDLQVYGTWFVGDERQLRYGTGIETPIYTIDRKDLIRTFREIEVPADAVADDGYLAVGFVNVPLNDTVVIFPVEGGLEVLYKADSFTANFLRAVLLILLRLVFLAALAVLAGSFVSFPVAILLALAVFTVANMSGFIIESFEYVSESVSGIYNHGLKLLIMLLPRFDEFNPSKYLVPGRLLGWWLLARLAVSMVCIKAVLLVLLAILIFSRREVAKVVV